MLQQEQADDYVVAMGEMHTVREFCALAFEHAGIHLAWRGSGLEEQGIDSATGKALVVIDPRYLRPSEVELLCGDASKAKEKLGWTPRTSFPELVTMMAEADLQLAAEEAQREALRT